MMNPNIDLEAFAIGLIAVAAGAVPAVALIRWLWGCRPVTMRRYRSLQESVDEAARQMRGRIDMNYNQIDGIDVRSIYNQNNILKRKEIENLIDERMCDIFDETVRPKRPHRGKEHNLLHKDEMSFWDATKADMSPSEYNDDQVKRIRAAAKAGSFGSFFSDPHRSRDMPFGGRKR